MTPVSPPDGGSSEVLPPSLPDFGCGGGGALDGEQSTATADLANASAARSNLAASREEARANPAAECVARTAARAASTLIFVSIFADCAMAVRKKGTQNAATLYLR